ncbi:hypothetical protein [Kitasatospora purpeofusca]|uniref:hypothetical protein n=1 Tax=Kitasatospora purpeofusca TaxID=67352 RepID=UPI0004BEE9F9|nr:hypothetical protein [Kitasatospora purpeofusca]
MTTSTAARFAASYALLRVAADVADHWVQNDHQASTKGQHDHVEGQSTAAGRRACLAHVTSYVAAQAAALAVGSKLLGLKLSPARVVGALVISAVTHYAADRREPLRKLADATGKGTFVRLADHGMNGAYALDQAWHHGWETLAAAIAAGGAR